MPLDLDRTLRSGQPSHFLWTKEGDRYYRWIGGERCEIWVEDGTLRQTEGFEAYVQTFLRTSDDLEKVYEHLAPDPILRDAISSQRGLRLTLNDPWETMLCFLCSIHNNLPRIRRNVQSLMPEGRTLSPEELLRTDLGPMRLGFRERYLREAAERAVGLDLDSLGREGYEETKEALLEFPGVGPKVADCILLFGYGFLEAFPVDVWIQRAMEAYYRKRPWEIGDFARERWGKYAGYAGQYLYGHAREFLTPRGRRRSAPFPRSSRGGSRRWGTPSRP
jgi:N-glycosylase/DNA lyase